MKRRRVIMVLVGIVVVATVAPVFWPRDREPVYQGKKLSEWLEIAEEEDPAWADDRPRDAYSRIEPSEWFKLVDRSGPGWARYREASLALRHIGSNGLPKMLKWLRYEPPPWQAKIAVRANRLPPWIQSQASVKHLRGEVKLARADRAAMYFFTLGPGVDAAVPELTRMMGDPEPSEGADRAIEALASLGPIGFDPLLAALSDREHPRREMVVTFIPHIRGTLTNGSPAVPTLIGLLEGTHVQLASDAAIALGRLKLDPELVVPALARTLEKPKIFVRCSSLMVLEGLGRDAASAMPALLRVCNDPDETIRCLATNALRKIAPESLREAGAEDTAR